MGELIDLDQKRRERWVRQVREMRELGKAAVFGSIGEQNATIIYLPQAGSEAPGGNGDPA